MISEPMRPPNYKTVPCRLYHSNAGCNRGEFCHFVHNPEFAGKEVPTVDTYSKKRLYNEMNYYPYPMYYPYEY